MSEYPLQFATRQIRRVFERAIGRSIPKILTELVTNADDSYRRIEAGANATDFDSPCRILIEFSRGKHLFTVTDQAEGLTDIEMEDRFVIYGQESSDRSKGLKTRSLFGKGLRDVLFTQRYGQVKSIKDGKFYNCQFRWKDVDGQERPVVVIKPPSRVTDELREALGIPANGTAVEFQLSDEVRNPQADKLIEKLSRFYMLRMINSSPHREIRFETIGRKGEVVNSTQLAYEFPELESVAELDEEIRTEDGAVIQLKGSIGLSLREFTQGEAGYEDREGGLLILDEDDSVLDLTLFGYDDDPNARKLAGIVHLMGGGDYIRRKLNDAKPEEILTETREGFDKNHGFYRLLKSKIQPHLAPIVDSLRDRKVPPKSSLSESTIENHKKAFDLLNRLYTDMLGKTGQIPTVPGSLRQPPQFGIAFATSHITLQCGVNTPVPLLLNRALVRPGDDIYLETDNSDIIVTPAHLVADEGEDITSAQIRIVRVKPILADITGQLTASWGDVKVVLQLTTTQLVVITPINGLEFERDEYSVRLLSKRHLRLFVDLEKIPFWSEISVSVEGTALKLQQAKIRLEESDIVAGRVAQIEISVEGLHLAKSVMVTASSGSYVAGTNVSVVKREREDGATGGIFKDWRFAPTERKIQSWFDPDGFIAINTKDPVNQRYFGTDPNRALEEHAYCQLRLADLILNECLQMMVSQALQEGSLDRRFPDNPDIDVRIYVDEKKFDIGPQIHALIVKSV
jgi:hypothetical protein